MRWRFLSAMEMTSIAPQPARATVTVSAARPPRAPPRVRGGAMRALVRDQPGSIESAPLRLRTIADPVPGRDELLLRVTACAVCRTDLQIANGDLAGRR